MSGIGEWPPEQPFDATGSTWTLLVRHPGVVTDVLIYV